MNISLRQIEVFLAVAQTLSFGQAAKRCHLSQPALSANVKRLEELLGARLFDRHTRKVALTAVGSEFLKVAKGLSNSADVAIARVLSVVAGRSGRVVIAAAPSMAATFAPRMIAGFSAAHPDVEFVLHDELSDLSLGMVRAGTADVALVPELLGATDLEQTLLFRDPLGVVCRTGHPLTQQTLVRWRDVRHYPQVVMNRSSSVRQLVDAQFARYGVGLRPAFEVAHVGTMLGLVSSNLGIGELPESFLQNIDMTGLAYLRIGKPAAYRRICATTRRGPEVSALTRAFIRYCKAAGPATGPRHSPDPRP